MANCAGKKDDDLIRCKNEEEKKKKEEEEREKLGDYMDSNSDVVLTTLMDWVNSGLTYEEALVELEKKQIESIKKFIQDAIPEIMENYKSIVYAIQKCDTKSCKKAWLNLLEYKNILEQAVKRLENNKERGWKEKVKAFFVKNFNLSNSESTAQITSDSELIEFLEKGVNVWHGELESEFRKKEWDERPFFVVYRTTLEEKKYTYLELVGSWNKDFRKLLEKMKSFKEQKEEIYQNILTKYFASNKGKKIAAKLKDWKAAAAKKRLETAAAKEAAANTNGGRKKRKSRRSRKGGKKSRRKTRRGGKRRIYRHLAVKAFLKKTKRRRKKKKTNKKKKRKQRTKKRR